MTALSAATLGSLSVLVPSYDRSAVTTGIVHFGVGGFHRAHQAMYLDRLMEQGQALDWGICGVGVMPFDLAMRDAMAAQDCLYTLVLKDPAGGWEPRVVGSIVEYLYAPDDPEAVIEKMADPATRIVSLTVTEGGYNFSPVTGEFDATNPAVQADLQPGAVPATVFGLVTEALVRRRERGVPPFTVMSCDNIQGNGHMAAEVFGAFARLREEAGRSEPTADAGLGAWVAENVRFPNSMVDRITPGTTDTDRVEIAERFGITDAWPVVCEPFTQWVLEDTFGQGRPPLENAGVQVVADVEPYELMKLRLLNASHQALCYLGYLSGYRLVHEVAQDPLFATFLRAYMDAEATPTLSPVPGIDLDDYKTQLVERFSNEAVRDTVARLCAESSDRIPKWLLPVIRSNLAAGRPVRLSAAVVAAWARYAEGVDEQGGPITIVDRFADQLQALAGRQHEEPLAFLGLRDLFGDLDQEPVFTAAYLEALDSLHQHGARATVERLVAAPAAGG
ncbi:mannitol dehydrogenase family protein [uncultured Friedmanniella sp.]|uniref:mannitol dehydrogenase family protein n=1 Tax=uncultured Friedmanniella sp. TaxID=335381 RepID=UPI0035CC37E1